MDRLEAMTMLVAAIEGGSLSAASRRLRTPLPTVSRRIAELEAHLGTKLVVRSTRRLTLTDAGAAYVVACRRILDDVIAAERTAAGEYIALRGELLVAAPIVFGRLHVLPIVTAMIERFPEVNVQLLLSDRNVALLDEHVDVAVRIGDLPDSSLIAAAVGTLRRVVCASPDFLAAHGEPAMPEALAALPCVTFDAPAAAAEWRFARPCGGDISVRVRPRLSVNTAEAAIDAAMAGVGLTRVLSYQAARAVAEGRLRIVLAEFEFDPVPVSLLHVPGPLPLKLRAFLDDAKPALRKSLSALAL